MRQRPAYTDDIWIRGLDEDAQAFIKVIPEASRAWWEKIVIEVPPEPTPFLDLFAVKFTRGRHWVIIPITGELLRARDPALVALVDCKARDYYDRKFLPDEAPDG